MWKHFPMRGGGGFEIGCLAIGAILLVIFLPATGNSQGLEGLDRVSVRVGTDWYAIPESLTVEDVELSVYITLRRILPDLTVDLVERTDPGINVSIQSLPIRADGTEIGYAIYVETSLVRNGSIEFSDIGSGQSDEIQVPVWSDSTLFISATQTIVDNVKSVIEDQLAIFASAFSAANSQ